jgi:PIN domain nuclease of toxin-antitoxin system
MILLDTHVWIWWVQGDSNLPVTMRGLLEVNEKYGLGVSVISCLEVARLVAYGRLQLPEPVDKWVDQALKYPHIHLIELTPRIAIESTRLPGELHKDPCDRIIIATARELDWQLATCDHLIRRYPAVKLLDSP